MKRLFTERHGGGKPRTSETLGERARTGLCTLLSGRIDEEWLGLSFPQKCGDGYAYAGTDTEKLRRTLDGYGLWWPADRDESDPPTDEQIFDLVEFAYEHIAEPKDPIFHSYMGHTHYSYDQASGQTKFEQDVNRIFERNGIGFHLEHGEVVRIAPAVLHDSLGQAVFQTGDSVLDKLLETSRQKFLNRSLEVRREALEKLWDAWERLKTIERGKDKKTSVKILLDKAAPEPLFRKRLDEEAAALTVIGNEFMIRHSEIDKVPVSGSAHVDYLFHRMFSLVVLPLKS